MACCGMALKDVCSRTAYEKRNDRYPSNTMPNKTTMDRVLRAKKEGKAPSTQAGEFVREEVEHIREGKHGARSAKQAIAIGLSKARRAGIKLKPPAKGKTSEKTRHRIERELKMRHRVQRNLRQSVPGRPSSHFSVKGGRQCPKKPCHARPQQQQNAAVRQIALNRPERHRRRRVRLSGR